MYAGKAGQGGQTESKEDRKRALWKQSGLACGAELLGRQVGGRWAGS